MTEPDGVTEPRAAAFFDLDRTLMAGSSGFHWARAAYRAGLLTRRQIAADAWANLQFRLRGSTDAETDELKLRLGDWLRGRRVRDLERLSPAVLAGVLPRLYPTMLRRPTTTRTPGARSTSAPPPRRARPTCSRTCSASTGPPARGWRSSTASIPAASTGPFCYGEGKPVRDAPSSPAREGLDLAASCAYSDAASDLPMLRAVGHPVAVNPDAELAQVARAGGLGRPALRDARPAR